MSNKCLVSSPLLFSFSLSSAPICDISDLTNISMAKTRRCYLSLPAAIDRYLLRDTPPPLAFSAHSAAVFGQCSPWEEDLMVSTVAPYEKFHAPVFARRRPGHLQNVDSP